MLHVAVFPAKGLWAVVKSGWIVHIRSFQVPVARYSVYARDSILMPHRPTEQFIIYCGYHGVKLNDKQEIRRATRQLVVFEVGRFIGR